MAMRETPPARAGSGEGLDAIRLSIALERYEIDARDIADAMLRKLTLADRAHRAVGRHGVDRGANGAGSAWGIAGLD
jgi:hypothetical protein